MFNILECPDVTFSPAEQSSKITEDKVDINLIPGRHDWDEEPKIIQDLDVYLLNYGLKLKDVAKKLLEISNQPQHSEGITN